MMYSLGMYDQFPQYTNDELDEILNTLGMTMYDFARRADLYELMFGVKTGSMRSKQPQISEIAANTCLRQALLELLVSVSMEAEKYVGFVLKERYVAEEFPFTFDFKEEGGYAGIETMNVTRSWEAVAGLSSVPVVYKLIDPVTIDETGGYPRAILSRAIITNPRNIWLRREDGGGAFGESSTGEIEIVDDAGVSSWSVPIDQAVDSYQTGEAVYAHDRQYAYVDITPPTLAEGETLEPVYPDSNLIIPQARRMQVLENGDHRYWFYVYTLVRAEMSYEDEIDLVSALPEFWKLLEAIEFRKWSEVSAPLILTVTQGDQIDTYTFDQASPDAATIKATLVSSNNGIFHISTDPCFSIEKHCGYWPTSMSVKVYYKVSPTKLHDIFRNQISRILQAISYRVAAEMPINSCRCKMESGFIEENRMETGKVTRNIYTNTESYNIAYGQRIGIEAYHAIMSEMLTNQKVKPML
jgi:hypothetical protein